MTTEQILTIVCDVFNITIEELRQKNRKPYLCNIRCICIQLMKEYNTEDKRDMGSRLCISRAMYYYYSIKFEDYNYDKELTIMYNNVKKVLNNLPKELSLSEQLGNLFDIESDAYAYLVDSFEYIPAISKDKFLLILTRFINNYERD